MPLPEQNVDSADTQNEDAHSLSLFSEQDTLFNSVIVSYIVVYV